MTVQKEILYLLLANCLKAWIRYKWQKSCTQIQHLPVKLDSGSCSEAKTQGDWRRNLRLIYRDWLCIQWKQVFNGSVPSKSKSNQIWQSKINACTLHNLCEIRTQAEINMVASQWNKSQTGIRISNNQITLGRGWTFNYSLSILAFLLLQQHQIYVVKKLKSWALNSMLYRIP